MLYPENYQGVLITPPLYPDIERAYRNQQDFLRTHPKATQTTSVLSPDIGDNFHEAHARYIREGLKLRYGNTPLAQESDNINPISGIALGPGDVEHIIESLQRQRLNHIYIGRQLLGTIGGYSELGHETRKAKLVLALHDACMASEFVRQELQAEQVAAVVIDLRLKDYPEFLGSTGNLLDK